MIFDTALRKDLGRNFVATLIVILTVVITLMLIRTLGQANKGVVSPSDIMLVMGYTVLGYMPIVLSLSMFIACVGTLGRMYRDSEMVIWFSSGLGLTRLLHPILRFAWPLLTIITLLALFAWPWSQEQIQNLRQQFEQRSDLDRVLPGEFQVSSSGDSVFFIDIDSNSSNKVNQVFLASRDDEKSAISIAQEAHVEHRPNQQTWVVLKNGQRIEQHFAPTYQLQVIDFDTSEVKIQAHPKAVVATTERMMPTSALFKQNSAQSQAELTWRFGLIFSAFNYLILALALTNSNTRSARVNHVVTGLLTFIVYFNLLSLAQNWVARGKSQTIPTLLLLHGGILLTSIVWLLWRHYQYSPFHALKRRRLAI